MTRKRQNKKKRLAVTSDISDNNSIDGSTTPQDYTARGRTHQGGFYSDAESVLRVSPPVTSLQSPVNQAPVYQAPVTDRCLVDQCLVDQAVFHWSTRHWATSHRSPVTGHPVTSHLVITRLRFVTRR